MRKAELHTSAVIGVLESVSRRIGYQMTTAGLLYLFPILGDVALRVEFDRLHGVSVKLEGATLLIGFASLFLTVRST